jgi:pimeloyl-ACP methyl ester carboxylesterase
MTESPKPAIVRRGFVDVPFGQVHYRSVAGSERSLVMLHASPGSSRQLVPLMEQLAGVRALVAPDTAGFGDSAAHPLAAPSVSDFALTTRQALDAMGLESFDLYGSHTGACIAAELAIVAPERIHCVVLDGVGLFEGEFLQSLLANYAPPFTPDLEGAYLIRAFQFCRDQSTFWPWFNRTRAGRRDSGLLPAERLHAWVVEVLKACETYQLGYHAAFTWKVKERLPLVTVPALMIAAQDDPLARDTRALAPLLRRGRFAQLPHSSDDHFIRARRAEILDFVSD